MKRNGKTRPAWIRWAIGCGLGGGAYVLLSLLAANLILTERLPEAAAQPVLCVAAAVAGLLAGAVCGGGERALVRGLIAGAVCAAVLLLVKAICAEAFVWSLFTTIAVASCVVCAVLGSCIFHKRNRKTTKKRKRKTHAK